jgi:hypothetical protein
MHFQTGLVDDEKIIFNNEKEDLKDYLYNKFSPVVLGFILKNTDSKKEAEDLLVQVFFKLNNEINDFKYDEKCRLIDIIRITTKVISEQKNEVAGLEIKLIHTNQIHQFT